MGSNVCDLKLSEMKMSGHFTASSSSYNMQFGTFSFPSRFVNFLYKTEHFQLLTHSVTVDEVANCGDNGTDCSACRLDYVLRLAC